MKFGGVVQPHMQSCAPGAVWYLFDIIVGLWSWAVYMLRMLSVGRAAGPFSRVGTQPTPILRRFQSSQPRDQSTWDDQLLGMPSRLAHSNNFFQEQFSILSSCILLGVGAIPSRAQNLLLILFSGHTPRVILETTSGNGDQIWPSHVQSKCPT